MPITPEMGKTFHDKIELGSWSGGEVKEMKFLDNGRDYMGKEYGLVYIYDVEYEGSIRSLWVRPNGPLFFGIIPLVTEEDPDLTGKTVKISKETGPARKDTRYNAEVV